MPTSGTTGRELYVVFYSTQSLDLILLVCENRHETLSRAARFFFFGGGALEVKNNDNINRHEKKKNQTIQRLNI